jgi:glucose/arabinose dehydrogenase
LFASDFDGQFAMNKNALLALCCIVSFVALCILVPAAMADTSKIPIEQQTGPNPTLPEPNKEMLPTVHTATPVGWDKDGKPAAAPGLAVNAFYRGLEHPRTVYVLPNGDVLVAETNAPSDRPEENKGLRGFAAKIIMKKAGAGVDSPDRITLLRDTNGDGVADMHAAFLENLHSPFGIALVGNDLYVANTDAVLRFPYHDGDTKISAAGVKLCDLPGGPFNHHWTKSLLASPDGSKLYVGVGSNSNVEENGVEAEKGRAEITEIDRATGKMRPFATGTRNPTALDWEPSTGALWAAVQERDEIGSDLVPDYITSVKDGGFYGWPYSYYGKHVDVRTPDKRPDLVEKAIVPDYAMGSHVAVLGLAFYRAQLLPEKYRGGAFVSEHGSWNRKPLSGYKVVFVPFANGKPNGKAEDVLTGFMVDDSTAYGRPVGLAVDKSGALLVADDVGNAVWRVTSGAR